MKKIKIICILLILTLLTACTIKHTYEGRNMTFEGNGFKYSCGKTPSSQEISFDPSKIFKPALSLLDNGDSNTSSKTSSELFLASLEQAKAQCTDFLKEKK